MSWLILVKGYFRKVPLYVWLILIGLGLVFWAHKKYEDKIEETKTNTRLEVIAEVNVIMHDYERQIDTLIRRRDSVVTVTVFKERIIKQKADSLVKAIDDLPQTTIDSTPKTVIDLLAKSKEMATRVDEVMRLEIVTRDAFKVIRTTDSTMIASQATKIIHLDDELAKRPRWRTVVGAAVSGVAVGIGVAKFILKSKVKS